MKRHTKTAQGKFSLRTNYSLMNSNKFYAFVVLTVAIVVTAVLLFRESSPASKRGARLDNSSSIIGRAAKFSESGTVAIPSGPLKVQYASPAPKIAPIIPDPTPAPIQAVVNLGKKAYSPRFYSARSERLAIKAQDSVPIKVSWPEDTTNPGVFVHAIQGGQIDGSSAKSFAFNQDKSIRFTFTAGQEPGLYQVLLRRGTTEEVLEFWVPTNQPKEDPYALK